MPISETGFADRLGRGRLLQTAIAGFSPAFAPADTSLAAAAFATFLADLDTQITETGGLGSQYTTKVSERGEMVKDVKARVLRVLSFVESNSAWKKYARGVKSLANKIRGNRPKAPKPPAASETPGSPKAKTRSRGEQSFAEIEENFRQLIALVQGITGYAPPATDLTAASLQTLVGKFAVQNTAMGTLGSQAGIGQRERLALYDGPGGLREKMLAIKKAVRAQYGSDSAEFNQVKGIKV